MKERPKGFLAKLYSYGGLSVEFTDAERREVGDYVRELHDLMWRVVRANNPGASGSIQNYIDGAVHDIENRYNADEFERMVAEDEAASYLGCPAPPKRWVVVDQTGPGRFNLEDIETGIGYTLSMKGDVETLARKLDYYAVGEEAPLNDEEQAIVDNFVDVADIFPKHVDTAEELRQMPTALEELISEMTEDVENHPFDPPVTEEQLLTALETIYEEIHGPEEEYLSVAVRHANRGA